MEDTALNSAQVCLRILYVLVVLLWQISAACHRTPHSISKVVLRESEETAFFTLHHIVRLKQRSRNLLNTEAAGSVQLLAAPLSLCSLISGGHTKPWSWKAAGTCCGNFLPFGSQHLCLRPMHPVQNSEAAPPTKQSCTLLEASISLG